MILKEYTFSCHINHENHFTKPIPHPVWWRRMLGQTKSYPIGWEHIWRTVEIPEELVYEPWVQNLLTVLPVESMNPMLEQHIGSRYIGTTGVENARTNHFLNSEK